MIREIKMFGAVCDHCKKQWEDDHNGWIATVDEQSIKQIISDENWHIGDAKLNEGKDGEHYCPECWQYDDDDNFILDPLRKNKYKKPFQPDNY